MSRHGPWAVLKIKPTDDPSEIKRAYAKQLKLTHPEDDAAGFQALRGAYEAALQHARWAAQRKQWAADQAARGEPVEADDDEDWDEEDEAEPEAAFDPDVSVKVMVVRPGFARPATAEELAAQPQAGEPEPDQAEPERARRRPATEAERAANAEPEPAPPPPPGPRVRVMAAAEMDLAEPPPELKEIHDAEQAHVALIQQLVDLVADDAATAQQRVSALEAVLKSPAMDMVIVNERTEHFLGGLIANNPRRTDEMVERVIAFFGWDAARVGAWRPIAEAALRRREEVIELRYLRAPGTRSHGAFRALSRRPTPRRILGHRFAIHRTTEVRNFLWNMRERFPDLVGELDAEAVAWWENHFTQPRIGPVALWGAVIGALLGLGALLAVLGGQTDLALALGNLAVIPAAVGGALIGKHYAVDRARELLGRRFNWSYPDWLRYGWLPVTMIPVIAAAFIPVSLPATVALGALAALPLLWAVIAADPDRSDEQGGDWSSWGYMSLITIPFYLTQWVWRPNMRYPWQVRAVFGFGFLAVFYAVILQDMDEGRWGQMIAPVAAAAFAVSLGLGSLIDAWRHETDRRRRSVALAVPIVCGLAGAGLAFAGPATVFAPASIVLLLVAVLAHKVPAKDADEGLRMFRDAITRFGWMGWIALSALLLTWNSTASPVFAVAAPWIVTGPLAVLAIALWREWVPKQPEAQRPRWDRA